MGELVFRGQLIRQALDVQFHQRVRLFQWQDQAFRQRRPQIRRRLRSRFFADDRQHIQIELISDARRQFQHRLRGRA